MYIQHRKPPYELFVMFSNRKCSVLGLGRWQGLSIPHFTFLVQTQLLEKQFPLNCIHFSVGWKQLREMKDVSVPELYWLPIPNYFWIRNTVVHIVAVKVLCTPSMDEANVSVYRFVSSRGPCKSLSFSQVLYFTSGSLKELKNQMNKCTRMQRGTWLIMCCRS